MNTPAAMVRLTSTGAIAASIPRILGYTPADSLVVIFCGEPRGKILLACRMDLGGNAGDYFKMLEPPRRQLESPATRVLIAIFEDRHGGAHSLVAGLRDLYSDLVVTDVVSITASTQWSYLCQDEACCPSTGTPLDPNNPAVAELVLAGVTQVADRSAYVARVQYDGGLRLPVGDAPLLTAPEVLAALQAQTGGIDWPTMSNIASGLADLTVGARDALISHLAETAERRALADLFCALLQRIPDEDPRLDRAALVAGAVLFMEGEGARATAALERITGNDLRMADLLLGALALGMPPSQMRQALTL